MCREVVLYFRDFSTNVKIGAQGCRFKGGAKLLDRSGQNLTSLLALTILSHATGLIVMTGMNLADKIAIVTGASRGLGKSMALALAKAGARIVATSPQADSLEAVANEIRRLHGADRCIAIVGDITKPDDCERLLAGSIAAFGGVDVLVNNARRLQRGPDVPKGAFSQTFWNSDPQIWSEAVEVNINGMFTLTRVIAPHMIARGGGRIVNITTSIDTMQRKQNSPYGVTKAAIDAATLIWSQDLAGTGVTCNALLPGGRVVAGDDPFNSKPVRPGGDLPVESMDRMVVWLASDLSEGVTGQRYVGKLWNDALPPSEAAALCREPPVLLAPAA